MEYTNHKLDVKPYCASAKMKYKSPVDDDDQGEH